MQTSPWLRTVVDIVARTYRHAESQVPQPTRTNSVIQPLTESLFVYTPDTNHPTTGEKGNVIGYRRRIRRGEFFRRCSLALSACTYIYRICQPLCSAQILLLQSPTIRATGARMLLPGRESVDVNQLLKFSAYENNTQRAVAIALSTTLIFFCLVAIYAFLAIDPRRLVFRHQLIAFLLLFDLLKAVILLLFPARVMSHMSAYFNDRFCQVVGFFTQTLIEGADFAILAFAIHTCLLIFRPLLNIKVHALRTEGGLYAYRYYVYLLCLVIPLVLALLPYIGVGYQLFVCWCYLPQKPVWYRLVLLWVPRWCIVVTILTVYCVIYVYVLREIRTLGGVPKSLAKKKKSPWALATYCLNLVRLPKLELPLAKISPVLSASSSTHASEHHKIAPGDSRTPHSSHALEPTQLNTPNFGQPAVEGLDTEAILDLDIQHAGMEHFRKRQKLIRKQMKLIFVYPFAYIFVWLFPFILQCTQFNYEETHKPIFWLNCMGAFMQPFNGFVDSLVFFYREEPWKYTTMRLFQRAQTGRLDLMVLRQPLDSETVDTVRLHELLISALIMAHVGPYKWWRRALCKLRLPLMGLPSEDSIAEFSQRYIQHRLEEQRQRPADFSALQHTHDYSNLLNGEIAEKDFRLALDDYSLNFQRRPLAVSQRTGLFSHKLGQLRRMSHIDPHNRIPEELAYVPRTRSRQSQTDEDIDFLDFLRRGP